MLGENWQEVQQTWVHRLGNLTLSGYNTEYSDRPFEEKKTIPGGFNDSAVRLNRSDREQVKWTVDEMRERTERLAERALEVWPALKVSQQAVEQARYEEMRTLAERRDVSKVKMSDEARALFEALRSAVKNIGSEILEVAERKSVSYHGPAFFMEVLPRRYSLTLLLDLDFNEIEDPSGIAQDATEWKFFVNAQHEGGVSMSIGHKSEVEKALPLIRQAHSIAGQ